MKTISFIILIQGLFLSSLLIFSCKKRDTPVEGSANNIVKTVYQDQETILGSQTCNTFCINPAGPFVEMSGKTTCTWGGPTLNQHTKSVNYAVYNTASNFVVKVTYTKSGLNTDVSDLIKVIAGGVEKSVPALASGATATFNFPLAQGWTKCQSIRFYIQQEGQGEPIIMASSYKLYETCYTCVTSFTGEAKSCGTQREAVYTFTTDKDLSNIKIQGGLTNFTGADAIISVTGGNLTATQSTVGGSSNRVIKIEGGVNACEKVTMNIKWNSTNSGGIITGSWSIKGSDGIDIAPAVEGLECH